MGQAVMQTWTDLHGWAQMPFLARLQGAMLQFETRRDDWFFAGRKRIRHKERGELHDRLPREERRKAMLIVGQYLAPFVQIKNLRVLVFPRDAGIARQKIADDTGLSLDSVKGAIGDLTSCGYIGGFQPCEKTAEGYRGRAAIRWLTRKFLKALGLWRAFEHLRKLKGLKPLLADHVFRTDQGDLASAAVAVPVRRNL